MWTTYSPLMLKCLDKLIFIPRFGFSRFFQKERHELYSQLIQAISR